MYKDMTFRKPWTFMNHTDITFQEFLDTFKVDQADLDRAIKTALLSAYPASTRPAELPESSSLPQVAEKVFQRSAKIGRLTEGITPNQFLVTLAEQNTLNSALLFLNLIIAKTTLDSIDRLMEVAAFREFQKGK